MIPTGLQRKLIVAHGKHGTVKRTYWVKPPEQETLRLSSGEKQRVKDPGIHPKELIRVSYGLIFSKDANRGVDTAIHSIGKVHRVPKDTIPVPMKVTGSLGGANGKYWLGTPEINVCKWSMGPAGTATHEYGHFLDHNVFGTGEWGFKGLATAKRSREIAPLMNAIYKSAAVKQLVKRHKELTDKGFYNKQRCAEYLLMPPELFARSYAQWVGLRAGGAVRSDTKTFGDQWRRTANLHAQWNDKDFEPIAREFDRLFARRGLLNTKRGARS